MNVTVKTGGARLVLRDVLRRPLVEVELGAVEGALKRLRPGVLQANKAPHAEHLLELVQCLDSFLQLASGPY